MAYSVEDVFSADVFTDSLFTGVQTTKISHLNILQKRIYLRPGVTEYHPVEDIYREVRYHRAHDESLRVVDMPVTASGNIPKGGGKYTPRLSTFRYGWKIVPANEPHSLFVSGEQITDTGESGPAAIDTSLLDPGISVIIQYEPPASELVRAEAEIEALARSSYAGQVVIDFVNGVPGTALGTGTYANPSNNYADAIAIANLHGLQTFSFMPGTYTIGTGLNFDSKVLRGTNASTVLLILENGASLTNSDIIDCTVTGTLNGSTIIRNSYVFDLEYFQGYLLQCWLGGWISIGGVMPASMMSCYGAVNGVNIDLQHIDHSLVMADYSGDVTFLNKDDNAPVKVYMNAGCINIDPTVTEGSSFHLDGTGHLNNFAGVELPNNRLISTVTIDDKLKPRFDVIGEKVDETQAFVLAS